MKKSLLVIFISVLCLLGINSVSALTATPKITCDKSTVAVNENVTCVVKATTNEVIKGFQADVATTNLTYVSSTNGADWSGGYNTDANRISLYTDKNLQNDVPLTTLVYKASQAGTASIKLSGIMFTDASFKSNDYATSLETNITVTSASSNSSTASESTTNGSNNSSSSSSKTESSTNDVKNPNTGNFVSYIVLGAGLVVAIVLYRIYKKKIIKRI